MAESDRDALDLLRRGKAEGFDLLYAQHHRRIYAFLFRLTGRRDTADDLFQETWLALARKGPSLWPDSHVEGWLFTVARNAFLTAERKQRMEWGTASRGGEAAADQASTTAVAPEVTLSDLERALLALPSDDRQLLLLVGVEGLGQDDIAGILGVAPATLRQRVVRARARLAEQLDGNEHRAPRVVRKQES